MQLRPKGGEVVPNHCHNRVTFYSDDTTAILKLHKIFLKGIETDDNTEPNDTVFGSFIPEPDWSKIPLTENDVKEYSFSNPRGEVGECPKMIIDEEKPLGLDCVSSQQMLWMIGGITGESITGELSGMLILWKWMTQICHTDSRSPLKLRGVHPKKSVMLSESNTTTFL